MAPSVRSSASMAIDAMVRKRRTAEGFCPAILSSTAVCAPPMACRCCSSSVLVSCPRLEGLGQLQAHDHARAAVPARSLHGLLADAAGLDRLVERLHRGGVRRFVAVGLCEGDRRAGVGRRRRGRLHDRVGRQDSRSLDVPARSRMPPRRCRRTPPLEATRSCPSPCCRCHHRSRQAAQVLRAAAGQQCELSIERCSWMPPSQPGWRGARSRHRVLIPHIQ